MSQQQPSSDIPDLCMALDTLCRVRYAASTYPLVTKIEEAMLDCVTELHKSVQQPKPDP